MFTTVVQGVSARAVRRKSDGLEMTIYDIRDQDGRVWTTTRKQLAAEANRLIGQPVVIDGKIQQNGNFLNHYLDTIREQNGHVSGAFVPPQGSVTAPLPTQTPIPTPPTPQPVTASQDRQEAIHRQTAAKVSAQISDTPIEFWSNLDDLVTYFNSGRKPTYLTPEPDLPTIDHALSDFGDEDIPF